MPSFHFYGFTGGINSVIFLSCTLRTRNLLQIFCDVERGFTIRQIMLTSVNRRQPVTIDYWVTWH